MVGRDHGIELAAHCSHKNRVSGERPIDSRSACSRSEELRVFAPESPGIAPMRIQRAQRDPRLRNAEPFL
jgi:hypothetical protein